VALTFRRAREEDVDRLVDIHASAFPDPRRPDARVRNFTRNPLGELSDLRVAEEGGAVLAHGFLFPLSVWVGGACVPAGGVATVGVAPEARGKGVGSRLVEHLHAEARARGDAFTLLYPFRQVFYGRLGYATTSGYRRLRLHPASIPWSCTLKARPATAPDLAAMTASWEHAARRGTGRLARSDRLWEARLSHERRVWLVVEGSRGVEGYVAWTLEQSEAHAETTLVVHEMSAATEDAERSLWGLVGAQRDQVVAVHADVAEGDPVDRAFVDADRARPGDDELEHTVGEVATGPMVAVTDATRALELRGWARDGRVVVQISEEVLAVTAADGRATVVPAREAPDVRLDTRTLAAVALGGLPLRSAARLGWATARDARALAAAAELLALPPYFSPDPF
jgi:predicted acetyltransferase